MMQQSHSKVFTLEKWNLHSHKNLYMNIYSSIICSYQDLETTQISLIK